MATNTKWLYADKPCDTKREAELLRDTQDNPWHWYVFQMSDGYWHIALSTSARQHYY